MGQAQSKKAAAITAMREEVLTLFKGQKLLLIGNDGSGKSSFINTVNHAMRLSDPAAKYQELAELGTEGKTKTLSLLVYKHDPLNDNSLFVGVKLQPDSPPIEFLDSCGMPEGHQNVVQSLIPCMARSQIDHGTDLREYFGEDFDVKSLPDNKFDNVLRCWSIIFVVSAVHALPAKLAQTVGKSCETLQLEGRGMRVFCVVTNTDKEHRPLEKTREDLAAALNIPKLRIRPVINYTSADVRANMTTRPDLKKEELALQAMLCFLQPAYTSSHSEK